MSGRVRPLDGSAPVWQVAAAVGAVEVVPVALVAAGAPPVALLPWLVPLVGAVTGLATAAGVTARRARRQRWAHGWGLDPDASTPGRPFAVTACPGREREFAADGLAWSVVGCPTPPRARAMLWCDLGHPAVIPQLSLWSPLARLAGREPGRRACPQGHPGVRADRPPAPVQPPVTTMPAARPAPAEAGGTVGVLVGAGTGPDRH